MLQQALDAIRECTDGEELRLIHNLIVDHRRRRIPILRAPRALCDILGRALGDNPHWY
jgi:hypothetical protein